MINESDGPIYNPFIYRSDKIENITKAMVQFQKNLKYIKKGDKGQFDYAKLETILYHVLPKLTACDISLEQSSFVYNDTVYLRTSVNHITGEFKAAYDFLYTVDMAKIIAKGPQDAGKLQQTLGTIKTYQCRYALTNLLCLPVMDKDFDDGEYITDEQAEELYKLADGNQKTLATLLEQLDVESSTKIKADDYDSAVEIINLLTKAA
jgi:hypothetical protein